MWARWLEVALGAWLLASPWIFQSPRQWTTTLAAAAVITLAAISCMKPKLPAHLLTGAIALALGANAYFTHPRPGPPEAQNDIVVSLLLLTTFLIPNQAFRPPRPWRNPG